MSDIWSTGGGVRLFALEQGEGRVLVCLRGGLASASLVATSGFVASGAQPYDPGRELAGIRAPTLVVPTEDLATHPPAVAKLCAASIPCRAVVPAAGGASSRVLGASCEPLSAGTDDGRGAAFERPGSGSTR